MDPLARLAGSLHEQRVRFLLIGVWGANLYARSGGTLFTTRDRDLLLPLDPDNLVRAWEACTRAGLALWCGSEPLDFPRDLHLASAVVERKALTTATNDEGLQIDLTLVMAAFTFDEAWSRRRTFVVDGVEVPVARLSDIVASKAAVGRPKDRLFLASHAEAIRELLGREGGGSAP